MCPLQPLHSAANSAKCLVTIPRPLASNPNAYQSSPAAPYDPAEGLMAKDIPPYALRSQPTEGLLRLTTCSAGRAPQAPSAHERQGQERRTPYFEPHERYGRASERRGLHKGILPGICTYRQDGASMSRRSACELSEGYSSSIPGMLAFGRDTEVPFRFCGTLY